MLAKFFKYSERLALEFEKSMPETFNHSSSWLSFDDRQNGIFEQDSIKENFSA